MIYKFLKIIVVSGEVRKGTLVFIAGDNLGSHGLGGYLENFSRSEYFRRHCTITRKEFFKHNGAFQNHKRRTADSYNNALNNIDGKATYKGIRFNSVFNRLKYHHVCKPGLPPCLGYGILEGVVAYDLKLYFDKLIRLNWFTSLDELNKLIDSLKYSTQDRQDKPCTVPSASDRIVGGAMQIWNFLRLFPLIIENNIEDIHSEVWRAILLLTEIVELVLAPEIHVNVIPYMDHLICTYLHVPCFDFRVWTLIESLDISF